MAVFDFPVSARRLWPGVLLFLLIRLLMEAAEPTPLPYPVAPHAGDAARLAAMLTAIEAQPETGLPYRVEIHGEIREGLALARRWPVPGEVARALDFARGEPSDPGPGEWIAVEREQAITGETVELRLAATGETVEGRSPSTGLINRFRIYRAEKRRPATVAELLARLRAGEVFQVTLGDQAFSLRW